MQNCMPKGGYKGKNPFAMKSSQIKGNSKSRGEQRRSPQRMTGQPRPKKKI